LTTWKVLKITSLAATPFPLSAMAQIVRPRVNERRAAVELAVARREEAAAGEKIQ